MSKKLHIQCQKGKREKGEVNAYQKGEKKQQVATHMLQRGHYPLEVEELIHKSSAQEHA